MKRLLAFSLLTALACTADTGAKGEEDAIPTDGKADSFRSPTEHGSVRFNVPSTGELSADERFHAWEFELEGDADIVVDVTSMNPNLDTVAYLYRRDTVDDRWGSYIGRNDDADETTLTSRIADSLGSGLYRIIVKGFKAAHVGPFDVTVSCDGACGTTTTVELPDETGYGEGCDYAIDLAYTGETIASDAIVVDYTQPEPFARYEGVERIALELYEARFGDEFDDYDVEYLNLEHQFLENGDIVSVDMDADEDTISYVFNHETGLVFNYWHNQSPVLTYYCMDDGAAVVEEPDYDCMGTTLFGATHDDATTDLDGTFVFGSSNDALDQRLRAAGEAYLDLVEMPTEDVQLEGYAWEQGARILATGEVGQAEYLVVFGDWGPTDLYVVSESYENADGTELLCTPYTF